MVSMTMLLTGFREEHLVAEVRISRLARPAARGVIDCANVLAREDVMKKRREAKEHKSRLRARRQIAAVRSAPAAKSPKAKLSWWVACACFLKSLPPNDARSVARPDQRCQGCAAPGGLDLDASAKRGRTMDESIETLNLLQPE